METVIIMRDLMCLLLRDNGGFALFNKRRRFNLRTDEKSYEVIGNIYDNPELLGGAE